ncbi:XRE family transcriptional regulator [Nocardia panacis]|uniref:XRE family transcriptional regulator n=1 Tax=Nocardia panacis TaxID=2340916 RepID=A0A3A4KTU9_9NOCA|nr:helix-turn-helix transcriptional regulator [Nocardia panacis]RJO79927.1 XRE family transcriptional regulator [Nocardia panacis]
MARSGFAEFLVARRAELRPADVGLPEGGRRRTPGLRREEVAVLAGLSADYLARLEQGRDTNPSMAVVNALANALKLEGSARHHFGWLSLTACQGAGCPGETPPEAEVSETMMGIVRALNPTPAFVLGRQLDVVHWNAAWAEFAGPLGLLDEPDRVNLATYTFTHPAARRVWREWDAVADLLIAALRRSQMRWGADTGIERFIEELCRTPEFALRWLRHPPSGFTNARLALAHPVHGPVTVPFETLDGAGDHSVAVWLVEQTTARTPALRLVGKRAANE